GEYVAEGLRVAASLGGPSGPGSFLAAERGRRRPRWVLKPLPVSPPEDGALRSELRSDFLDLASFRHPSLALPEGIVRELGSGRPYLRRSYVEGSDIRSALRSLSPRELCPWMAAAAEALDVLHRFGFLHRNIKLSNCMIPRKMSVSGRRRDVRVVLCDPAWWPAGSGPSPRDRPTASTPVGAPRVSDDLYAFGWMFYTLLVGEDVEPREGGFPLSPSEVRGDVPLDLERILMKLLNPEPERRYASAAELLDDLGLLRETRPLHRSRPPDSFVGRGDELARAVNALEDRDRAVVLAVTGEAGMGKSVFLERLALEAQVLGYRTVTARCYLEKTVPALPVRTLVERLVPPGKAGRSLRLRCRRLFDGPRGPDRSPRTGEPRAFLRELLELLSGAASGGPALLLLDEVHQADSLTVDFLATLLGEIAAPASGPQGPLALPSVAVSYRSESPFRGALRPLLDALNAPGAAHRVVELLPLSAQAVDDWLSRALPGDPEPGRTDSDGVRFRGNPFAIREALRMGRRGDEEPARATDLPSIHVEYLDSLDDGALKVLEALAVLGRPAAKELVASLVPLSGRALTAVLEDLERDGTLSDEGGTYFFRHGSFHDWFLSTVEEERRKLLHGGIAEVLERRRGEPVEDAAHHWLASSTPARGVASVLRAARQLVRGHERRRALSFYREVLRLLPSEERELRREVLEEASEAHARAGQHSKAAELFRALLEEAADARERGRIHGRLGMVLHRGGDVSGATFHLEKGRSLLGTGGGLSWLRERLRLDSELAEISNNKGEYEASERTCRGALELLEGVDGSEADADVQREKMVLVETLAHLRLRCFQYDEARALFEESLRLGEELDAMLESSLILNNLGTLHASQNRFHEAIKCCRKAAKLAGQVRDDQSLAVIHSNLAVLHAKSGDVQAADECIRLAARCEERCDSQRTRFLRLHSAGLVDVHCGRYASAIESFQHAISLGEELKDQFVVAFDWMFLGECHLFRGEAKAAQAAFERALGPGSRVPQPVMAMVEARRAALAAIRGENREARRAAAACGDVPLEAFPYVEASNSVFLGWARRLLGQREAARDELKRAARFFSRARLPAGEIHARLELAALEADGGHLARAERILRSLRRIHTPGRGVLRNSMLSARLLAYETRLLLDRGRPDVARATALLVEAESFLIGRRLRDLENLVRALKRRIRSANPVGSGWASVAPSVGRPATSYPEDLLESVREELADLAQCLEEELGDGKAPKVQRRLDRIAEHLRQNLRSFEDRDVETAVAFTAASILGRSPAVRRVVGLIRRFAACRVPVIVTGETGTGKELVARAVHGESSRRQGRFLSTNCAALPDQLLEAELFGYSRGAFSGAEKDHAGLLLEAHGGSFLFDEVGEMPLGLQSKLLRALDRGHVRPVGASEEIEIDVRFLFSTNHDLHRLVEEGKFRRDLYYRLGNFEIAVPPLRERLEDLPELVDHFRRQAAESGDAPPFDESALRELSSYPWPGNIRQLENVVTRLVLTSRREVGRADVRLVLGESCRDGLFSPAQLRSRPLKELHRQLEKEFLLQLHSDLGGDLKAMAGSLDITVRALYVRFRRLGIDVRRL
ncbi:MAG: sigma 54-interacting transcriptional regulator, partial [Planctomycetota bacterium]|nr:sigma 54-interacting transcriptional regulator [Planctomycetota bacterium]